MSIAVSYDHIPKKPVHWLHEGFVPFRHVTLVVAARGTCKGLWTLDYAARLSRHDPMPGEDAPRYDAPMDTIVILPEDDPNEAVAGRLEGAGAAADRIHNLTVFADGSAFTLQHDIGAIGQAIAEIERDEDGNPRIAQDGLPHKVGMVILDPLLALSDNDLRTRAQARPVIEALEALAKKHHLAVFLTHHTNADGKAASSRAIVETVRHEVTLARLPKAPEDSKVRMMTVTKTNIGEMGLSERFAVSGTLDAPKLTWASEALTEDDARGYDIAAVPDAASAAAASAVAPCRHPWKAGSCSDCPMRTAGRHAAKPAPAKVMPKVPARAAQLKQYRQQFAGVPRDARYRASRMISGGTPQVIGDYASAELARQACMKAAGRDLEFAPVPVAGMVGASVPGYGGAVLYGVLDRYAQAAKAAA